MNDAVNDDRFHEMKRLDQDGGDYDMPALVNPLPAERPIGAQHVAVKRKTTAVLAEIKALAAAAGDAWYYRWPVNSKEDGGKKWIEGPSIKLANDLARLYGNCDVDVRVVEDNTSWVFYARFMDLETGFSMTRPFQQRKSQKSIRGDSDRQRDIAFQIGASKAIRNVVVNSLQTYADYGFEEARNSLIEKIGKNIDGSRARLAEMISERNIEPARIERMVGRTVSAMLAPDIAKVLAMLKAIDDGMATVGETFPHETVGNPLANEQPAIKEDVAPQLRQESAGETIAEKATHARRTRKAPQAVAPQAPEPQNEPLVPGTVTAGRALSPAEREVRQELLTQYRREAAEQEEHERGRREAAERAEQEQDEARAVRDVEAMQKLREADASKDIPGFLDRRLQGGPVATAPTPSQPTTAQPVRTFYDEAIEHIGKYQGSSGSLMDWFRSKRAERASLSHDQSTHISQVYTAKFNELNAADPL